MMGKRSSFERIPRDFWAKADKSGSCWVWTGCVGSDGYGHVRHNGSVQAAHRVAFEIASGRRPSAHVLHSCDNPLCINPEHLTEGTHAQNMRECADRKRNTAPRPGNGRRKLSDADLDQIRACLSAGAANKSAIAREFGVTASRIRQVANG